MREIFIFFTLAILIGCFMVPSIKYIAMLETHRRETYTMCETPDNPVQKIEREVNLD